MSPIKRLFHWGPLASVAIAISLSLSTISICTSLLWIFIFQLSMCLTLYHMWCATLIGPGYISITSPSESTESGRFCRRCCQIVLRKHHHCPWINNCVGRDNEQYYKLFLLFAIVVTVQAATHLLINTLNNAIVFFSVFNIGLSLGVLIAVSVLLYTY